MIIATVCIGLLHGASRLRAKPCWTETRADAVGQLLAETLLDQLHWRRILRRLRPAQDA